MFQGSPIKVDIVSKNQKIALLRKRLHYTEDEFESEPAEDIHKGFISYEYTNPTNPTKNRAKPKKKRKLVPNSVKGQIGFKDKLTALTDNKNLRFRGLYEKKQRNQGLLEGLGLLVAGLVIYWILTNFIIQYDR